MDLAAIDGSRFNSKVNLPEGVKVDMAAISPNGDYLLVADQQKQGLQKLDLATGQLTTVYSFRLEYDAKILDKRQHHRLS